MRFANDRQVLLEPRYRLACEDDEELDLQGVQAGVLALDRLADRELDLTQVGDVELYVRP